MQRVVRFQADDRTEFVSEAKCRAYEGLCAEVDVIMQPLPRPPIPNNFANGAGYLQHDPIVFHTARRALLGLAQHWTPHTRIAQALAEPALDPGFPWRILSEGPAPISKAWYRFMCVDRYYREWGQLHFAVHPENGTHICLNPKDEPCKT